MGSIKKKSLISRTHKEQRLLRNMAECQTFAVDANSEQEPNEHAVVL